MKFDCAIADPIWSDDPAAAIEVLCQMVVNYVDETRLDLLPRDIPAWIEDQFARKLVVDITETGEETDRE